MRSRAPLALLAAAVLGVLAGPAAAETVLEQDDSGRTITFEVDAAGAEVAGYARILRRSLHGPEMDGLRVRVVPVAQVQRTCNSVKAVGCYATGPAGAVFTIPALPARQVRDVLLHEYGHHLDAAIAAPAWWAARRMQWRIATGQVVTGYARGSGRSVAEIFAEDYVALHVRSRGAIRWLPAPSPGVRKPLRADIAAALPAAD